MSFKQDWMERQIESLAETVAAVVFGKEKIKSLSVKIEENMSETFIEDDILEHLLEEYLKKGEICKAEDLLFDSLKENPTPRKIIAGLKFYNYLDEFSNDFLKEKNFSKEEIVEGLQELKKLADF